MKKILGIALMDSKAASIPMLKILEKLSIYDEFEALVFGDKVILEERIESWPICHYLIAFFSTGFPLQKAIDYVQLRKPITVNNLSMQKILLDRRLVLSLLDTLQVPTPKRLIVSRDGGPFMPEDVLLFLKKMNIKISLPNQNSQVAVLDEDRIKIGDQILTKPFVEKPVDGEDHNIWIYYSKAQGGGARKLFRKVANKSSEYVKHIEGVRKEGSFIYEEFMKVDNSEDVKVYTVGPEHFHAETRKSPVVDGIVKRNADGKELRFITNMTDEEKEFSKKICHSFGQLICGLDVLRVNGKSFVIDVNGWSFVKGNEEYYEICARFLHNYFIKSTV